MGTSYVLAACGERCGLWVVGCEGCPLSTVPFLLVRPVNPIKNLANIIPSSKTMVGWRLEQGAN